MIEKRQYDPSERGSRKQAVRIPFPPLSATVCKMPLSKAFIIQVHSSLHQRPAMAQLTTGRSNCEGMASGMTGFLLGKYADYKKSIELR